MLCDYNKKTLVVENTNLTCEIKAQNWNKIDFMMFENAYYPFENIKCDKDDDFIVKLHDYQTYHSKGFIINTLEK